MSVDVEALIQKITAEVTKQVLAAVSSEPSDDWPDWDEFNQMIESPVDSSDSSESITSTSSLRARLSGVTDEIAEDEEDGEDEISQGTAVGTVAPIAVSTFSNQRGGFDPRSNPSWFEAQYHREVVLPSRVAPR